ncbi:MAG: radical SAM family heme chaperone HemW [bacterium]|nr:radical SAM family heme chaperone HemW [bacterium]
MKVQASQTLPPLGLYLHIPFCAQKCAYCDFVSYAGQTHKAPEYVQALYQEFLWYLRQNIWERYQPYTLYIGGGTPSLALEALLSCLQKISSVLPLDSFVERTVEINPGTIRLPQLRQLRQAGLNRLSIGIQSFHDDELRVLGRIHSSDEALHCVQTARQAGFDNISLDLIFGLPSSSPSRLEDNVNRAIDLKPEHISIYNLTIEEGTPFWQQQQDGTLVLPDEELQIEMYRQTRTRLCDAGYEHYEISNFAKPGFQSRHNRIYWRNEEYLGLGAGAYSYLNGTRYGNTSDVDSYIRQAKAMAALQQGEPNCSAFYPLTVEHHECLSRQRQIGETIMMNLRLLEGLDLQGFQQRFGQALEEIYPRELEKLSSLELIEMQHERLRLSSKGLLLANEVCQEFLVLTEE